MKCQNRERGVRIPTSRDSDGINPDLDLPLDPIARGTDTLVDPVATPPGRGFWQERKQKKRDERASSLVPRQRD